MDNFASYFLRETPVFLDNISYESLPAGGGERSLNCKDTVVAQVMANGVKITFNRTLNFDPEGPYSLSVTFGTLMLFDPRRAGEVDWSKIDVAGEFRKGCPQLVGQLMSRTSMLVAQITSAAGQPPIITPGTPQRKGN